MYLRQFSINGIRSISNLEMEFEKGCEPGWHVVLGPNGAGKSSVIRSFALLAMGEKEAYAARQDFGRWIRNNADEAFIKGSFSPDEDYDVLSGSGKFPNLIKCQAKLQRISESFPKKVEIDFSGERTQRTIWGDGQGWFSASFGPFRRFTGGDRIYDRLFVSNRRLAPHLTALGEDVALTEALGWLTSLYVQSLQDARYSESISEAAVILEMVVDFLNESGFFPHGAEISEVTNDSVSITDGNQQLVPIDQLSDGYRSALSMAIELIRQMFALYGLEKMQKAMNVRHGSVMASGVVAIDEVDAHLHPTWQRDIGRWLTRCFPRVQFIVTTHSPIVCRAVANEDGDIEGSVWRLPAPGSDGEFFKVEGADLDQLVFGDVLDAYGTELFGSEVTRSRVSVKFLDRLAYLNTSALERDLTEEERRERKRLRATFPSEAGRILEN